jgi:tripartite-type tricarboxylate transporter receptor subunit TctC
VQARLRDAAVKALQQPLVRGRLSVQGMQPGQPSTPDELAKLLRAAHERQGALLKSINFKPE